MANYSYGKNVIRQLLMDNKKIFKIYMQEGFKDPQIESLIRKKNLPVEILNKQKMSKMFDTTSHQGIAASIEEYKTYTVDEILASIPKGKLPLLVMLDGLEDPHNLGAILRTCDCIGADGVIIAKNRSVQLTPTVAKVSTGAIDTVKTAVVTNLSQTIEQLKQKGFWVAGADGDAKASDYRALKYDVPLVLVIGSEGFGISKLVKKNCDYLVKLPMVGSVTSLNASVACAILLYEIYSKRHPL